MTVCRYFRNGYCRNGDACRFEHSYHNQRPPLLNAPTYQSAYTTGYGQRGHGGTSGGDWRNPEQQQQQSMVDQIITDIDLMLRGKQYLFSCVPGRQPHLNCKNLSDLSPEEMRVKFLECQAMNNTERFLSEMSSHRIYVEGILRQLSKNPSMLDDVQPYMATSIVQQPSQSETGFAANPSFGSPGGSSSPPFSTNFGAQSPPSFGAMSPVGPGQQPANPMPTMGGEPRMLFGKAVQSSGSLFDANRLSPPGFQQVPQVAQAGFPSMIPAPQPAQPMPSHPGFPMQPVHQVAQHVPSPQVPSPFAMPNPAAQTAAPPSYQTSQADDIYSNLMDMSPEDLAAYQERAFTIAGVPLMPPAKEHCF